MRGLLIAFGVVLMVLFLIPENPVIAQAPFIEPGLFTGSWLGRNHENDRNPLTGDYSGIPLNDEARARADAWSNTSQEMPERQCIPYTSFYMATGVTGNVAMWGEVDEISHKVIDWKMKFFFGTRTIWMDGRPHPPASARHTALGFSTGEMIGDMLHVRTTHLAEGMVWQNGVASSTQAEISEYIFRADDLMSVTMIQYDPIYLEEPLIRTKTMVLQPNARLGFQFCDGALEIPRKPGQVAHWLPGENKDLQEASQWFGIPNEGMRGGAATLYPEFRKKIKDQYKRPAADPPWALDGRFR